MKNRFEAVKYQILVTAVTTLLELVRRVESSGRDGGWAVPVHFNLVNRNRMMTAGCCLNLPSNRLKTFPTVPFSSSGNITSFGKGIASLPTFCFNMLLHVLSWFLNWKKAHRESATQLLKPLYGELEDVIMQNFSET
jgi:hypothetical protein